MELEPRSKQTEAGPIPEDWIAMPLSEIGSFKNGINKPAEAFGHGSPFINLMDVFGIPRAAESNEKLGLINSTPNEQKAYNLHRGDVLFVRSSVKQEGVGLTTLIPKSLPSTVYSGFLIRFRDRGLLTTDFKQYCFLSDGFRKQILANCTVSANTNINQDALKQLQVAFPPCRQEQNRIAKVLREADLLISSINQLIVKKQEIKHGAMQELLTGKRRLPGFEGEWATVSLGSVAAMNSGGTPSTGRDDFYGGGIPWVSITDMTSSGRFISETERTLTDLGLANCAAKRFPAGTILYAMYASLGECSIAAREVTTSQAILGIRPGSLLINEYLYYWLKSICGSVKLMGQQGTQSNLNKKMVQEFSLGLPGKDEQLAIANVLGDIDNDVDALKIKLEKAHAMKNGIIQQLLTGKIRLK